MKLQMFRAPRPNTVQGRVQMATSTSWRSGKTTGERGYGYRWQKAREAFLRQPENALCVMCKAQGRLTEATVVDHRIPHRGDQRLFWDRSNWQSLCKPHHDGEKKRQEHRQGL